MSHVNENNLQLIGLIGYTITSVGIDQQVDYDNKSN